MAVIKIFVYCKVDFENLFWPWVGKFEENHPSLTPWRHNSEYANMNSTTYSSNYTWYTMYPANYTWYPANYTWYRPYTEEPYTTLTDDGYAEEMKLYSYTTLPCIILSIQVIILVSPVFLFFPSKVK